MESPLRRDVSELLAHGYFKTARGRSPSGVVDSPAPAPANVPAFLNASEHAPRGRSRSKSQDPRRPPPPRPMVEDEAVSLARESDLSSITIYDPPQRGVVDQHPIMVEVDVPEGGREAFPRFPKEDNNPERRFVLMPKSDTYSPNKKDEHLQKGWSKPSRPEPTPDIPPRPRNRQDLPALQTKIAQEIPPQSRTSASSLQDQPPTPGRTRYSRTHSELLSPDVKRRPPPLAPRHYSESLGSKPRSPSSSRREPISPSRPLTPLVEKRSSGSYERPARDSSEKPTRSQKLSEEEHGHHRHRRSSSHSNNLSVDTGRRHDRSRSRSSRHSYSSDSDTDRSDSGRSHTHRHRQHKHHRHRELQVEDDPRRRGTRGDRSSGEFHPAHRKYSSPIPSPKASPNRLSRLDRERAETYPQRSGSRSPIDRAVSPFSAGPDTPRSSADRLDPLDSPIARPRSRQGNPISTPTTKPYPPIPTAKTYPAHAKASPVAISPYTNPLTPDEVRRTSTIPKHNDNKQQAPDSPYWQPPSFQPPSSNPNSAVGSYRRFSEDLERGSIAPLPACPRTKFTRGNTDWFTLPQCPSFDICPSCYEATVAPTEFRGLFIKAPPRPPETEIVCDFGSSPWYRIAWLLTIKDRRRDLKLFYELANVGATCPQCLGANEAVRQWHFVVDPKTRSPVHNFNVCPSCVRSIEVLLPGIRGIFMKDPNRPIGAPQICDFRFDSKRFIQYFDTLETTADKAEEVGAPPDSRAIVGLAKRMAALPECQQQKDLVDRQWNVITQLPEFTVCEECFEEVVWPELEDEKAIPMMFNKALQRLPKASCQLYSPKMRGIFCKAVDGDDYKLLASKARERKTVETAYKSNLEGLRRQASLGKINPQFAAMETRRVEDEWAKWA